MESNPKLEKLIQGVGSLAEMAYVFYDAELRAGADENTAYRLTQAYIAATIYGNKMPGSKKPAPEKKEEAENE